MNKAVRKGFTPLEKRHSAKGTFSLTGFTLIEIIIAMLLLTFAATGIFAGFVSSKRYSNLAYHRLQSLNLARRTLESLRMDVDATTWGTPASDLNVGLHPLDDFLGPDGITFERSYDVGFIDLNGNEVDDGNEPHNVTITISWHER